MKLHGLKTLSFFTLLVVILTALTACGKEVSNTPTSAPVPTDVSLPTSPPPTAVPTPNPDAVVFRADPERSGSYAQAGDFGEWAFDAGSPVASSPILAGDTLYFGTMTGNFFALDPMTQKVRWQVAIPPAIFSSPAVVDGLVYFGGVDGSLYALDAVSGEERWKFPTSAPIFSSPTVWDGKVFFGGSDGNVYALDALTGSKEWEYKTAPELVSSPLVVDGTLLIGGRNSFLYALDALTGQKKWMYLAEGDIQSSPAVSQGVVFLSSASENNNIHAVDLETGKVLWRATVGPAVSSIAIRDGVLYTASVRGQVAAGLIKGDSLLWSFQSEDQQPVISSPAVAEDRIITGDTSGLVRALDRRTGEELWSFETYGEIWSSPALVGNTAFIGSNDGYLYALDIRGPELAQVPLPTPLPLEPTPTALLEPPSPTLPGTDGLAWWNDRVFYEVFVRSFKDSNADGIGDLQGLIEKLDYLNDGDPSTTSDLGVTGLWLMPVAESPSYHGYDVTDYRTIEADYGTNEDFKQLVEEAHKRGIAVIVDMVMNHTSSQHPWFREAAYPGSTTENWYIWSDTNPGYKSPWDTDVWHQPPVGDLQALRAYHTQYDYYYGLFWYGMPDLNYRNGAVTQEMFDILSYWLTDMDVDGFRLDAVRHLIEDGADQENTPETHTWLQNFDNYVHTVYPDALTVGEIWDETAEVAPYVPDELDIAFEFKLAEAIIASLNAGENSQLVNQAQEVLKTYPEGQFAPFLTNHDMTRVMSQLGGDAEKAKAAAALLLSHPGVPFLYYGEEIGMTGVKPEDINVRLPMRWDGTETAGFTTGNPWVELGKETPQTNVASQAEDPTSLLSRYRDMIRLRQEHAALRAGDTWLVTSDLPQVYSLLRYSEGEGVLVLVNLSGEAVKGYKLALESGPFSGPVSASSLLGEGQVKAPGINPQGGFDSYTPLPELPPYAVLVIQLK